MPLRRGWSREVIGGNISEMVDEGYSREQAIAASLDSARKSYRSRHPSGPYPRHIRKRSRPNPPMTYGTMPSKRQFDRAFRKEVPDGFYKMHLKGADFRAADGTTFDHEGVEYYDSEDLYDGVTELVAKWNDGSEQAGDLASSILLTLGFEWF